MTPAYIILSHKNRSIICAINTNPIRTTLVNSPTILIIFFTHSLQKLTRFTSEQAVSCHISCKPGPIFIKSRSCTVTPSCVTMQQLHIGFIRHSLGVRIWDFGLILIDLSFVFCCLLGEKLSSSKEVLFIELLTYLLVCFCLESEIKTRKNLHQLP